MAGGCAAGSDPPQRVRSRRGANRAGLGQPVLAQGRALRPPGGVPTGHPQNAPELPDGDRHVLSGAPGARWGAGCVCGRSAPHPSPQHGSPPAPRRALCTVEALVGRGSGDRRHGGDAAPAVAQHLPSALPRRSRAAHRGKTAPPRSRRGCARLRRHVARIGPPRRVRKTGRKRQEKAPSGAEHTRRGTGRGGDLSRGGSCARSCRACAG